MKSRFTPMVAATLLAFAVGTQVSVETTIGQEKTATSEKAPAKPAKKISGRLPAYYGQVGLSDEQRTTIYGIQATYRPQIAELQKQIDSLKEKEGSEVVAVLTADQKKKLDELIAEAKKAAEARRNKKKSS